MIFNRSLLVSLSLPFPHGLRMLMGLRVLGVLSIYSNDTKSTSIKTMARRLET